MTSRVLFRSGAVLTLCAGVLGISLAVPKPSSKAAEPKSAASYFYVYTDQGSKKNHFAPSGWMGDYGDLKVDQGYKENTAEGRTCIRVTYSAQRRQGAGWAGIYWQQPANNWGDKGGGYDLSKYKKLTFWARGAMGGEKVSEFKVGGIAGQTEKGDSDTVTTGPITLTSDWKQYAIELDGKDMSYIIGGFCFAAAGDENPNGWDIFVDEVRYE